MIRNGINTAKIIFFQKKTKRRRKDFQPLRRLIDFFVCGFSMSQVSEQITALPQYPFPYPRVSLRAGNA